MDINELKPEDISGYKEYESELNSLVNTLVNLQSKINSFSDTFDSAYTAMIENISADTKFNPIKKELLSTTALLLAQQTAQLNENASSYKKYTDILDVYTSHLTELASDADDFAKKNRQVNMQLLSAAEEELAATRGNTLADSRSPLLKSIDAQILAQNEQVYALQSELDKFGEYSQLTGAQKIEADRILQLLEDSRESLQSTLPTLFAARSIADESLTEQLRRAAAEKEYTDAFTEALAYQQNFNEVIASLAAQKQKELSDAVSAAYFQEAQQNEIKKLQDDQAKAVLSSLNAQKNTEMAEALKEAYAYQQNFNEVLASLAAQKKKELSDSEKEAYFEESQRNEIQKLQDDQAKAVLASLAAQKKTEMAEAINEAYAYQQNYNEVLASLAAQKKKELSDAVSAAYFEESQRNEIQKLQDDQAKAVLTSLAAQKKREMAEATREAYAEEAQRNDALASLAKQKKKELSDSEKEAYFEESLRNPKAPVDQFKTEKKFLDGVREVANAIKTAANFLNEIVKGIRGIQQQFGVNAGVALKIGVGDFMESFSSFFSMSKAMVSGKQIREAQSSFQTEFGGVLTPEAGAKVAERSVRLGITPEQQATSRRTFMTQAMGNLPTAEAAENKFIAEFEAKNLTAKDAMLAISQNSELLARNGTRFATSFARAAADAKKIGVDLSKVDQVGDSIISDFEGFLEKQAELGAMGFNFDSNKLAQVAETGDTGELFNELRSQLASTGKDITKLRRSEQLALSGAFGIPMAELQRMAGPTAGSGEKTMESLQEESNKGMSMLVGFVEKAGVILGIIAGIMGGAVTLLLTGIKLNTAIMAGKSIAGGAGPIDTMKNIGNKILGRGQPTPPGGPPPVPPGPTPPPMPRGARMMGGAKMGAGMGAITGLVSGIAEYQESGSIKKAFGRGLANMAGSIIGGALGSFIPIPGVGTMLGAAAGGWAANWLFDQVFADDMTSKSGYGDRKLVTPTQTISLNNQDNVVSYADDMISQETGINLLSKGSIAAGASPTTPQATVDLSKLEKKLDQVIAAIGGMGVYMDGAKVGKMLHNSNDKQSVGMMRQQALESV